MTAEIRSYIAFWPHYLKAHRHPRSRALHYLGTFSALLLLLFAALERDWHLLAAAPAAGYACAWIGHAVFEHNRPATFGHPLWSLYSDFRMFALWLAGRLQPEFDAAMRGTPSQDAAEEGA
jgi:hypothetical protein